MSSHLLCERLWVDGIWGRSEMPALFDSTGKKQSPDEEVLNPRATAKQVHYRHPHGYSIGNLV